MFEEQYRRDNDKLHAKEALFVEIQNRVKKEEGHVSKRNRFVRYLSVAAVGILVIGSAFGLGLGMGKSRSMETMPIASSAAAVNETALPPTQGLGETTPLATEVAEDGTVTLASYDALYDFIQNMDYYHGGGEADARLETAVEEAPAATESSSAVMKSATSYTADGAAMDVPAGGMGDYSETNVQVRGIDEADVVKTDGDYIYYVAYDQLVILKAAGADTKLLSVTYISENNGGRWGSGAELFLKGDRLMLIVQNEQLVYAGSNRDSFGPATLSLVFDVSDRTKPKHVTTLGQSGYYHSARLVGDIVYLVTNRYVYRMDRAVPESFVPTLSVDDKTSLLPAESILPYPGAKAPTYTVISSFDLAKGTEQIESRATLGRTDALYCNGDILLLAAPNYMEQVTPIAPDESGRNVQITTSHAETRLLLFALDEGKMERLASGAVKGTLINQFAIDAYNGTYRFVTTNNAWEQRIYTDGVDTYEYEDETTNAVYVLNDKLEILGALEGLAKDEWVESVRFDGELAYFVTFRQVDPLFAVDLSDPEKPVILSELKIPGFSEYLHPYSEKLLLGLGYRADEKTGRTQGVKLSMFDISDKKNVTQKHTYPVPADWTEVGQNHRAILVDATRRLIAFPAGNIYYIYTYAEETGFTEVTRVDCTKTHDSWLMRGLWIRDCFYVISPAGVDVLSLGDFSKLKTITFSYG